MSKHPESIFSDTTWKGENGNQGIRNLYGLFSYLLAIGNISRYQNQPTPEQAEVRKKAAKINLERMYSIGARIKNGDYVSTQEKIVWERVNYDINREVLRSRLRAFEYSVMKSIDVPEILSDKQSHMTDLFKYIIDHLDKLETWDNFPGVIRTLEDLGITLDAN